MKTPTLSPELKTVLKKLKLGPIISTLPERMVLAEKQQLTLDETLLLVLSDEVTRRDSSASTRRAAKAGLDPEMTMERWDGSSKVRYDKRVLAELMSLRFVEANKNAVILGAVGVGKTFLANALGHVATRHGYHVIFTRADAMLRRLKQSRMDNSRDAVIAELASIDLLIVDVTLPPKIGPTIPRVLPYRQGEAHAEESVQRRANHRSPEERRGRSEGEGRVPAARHQ